MADEQMALASASSNCHSYSASVAPANEVLAHIRSAASTPRDPMNRPDQSTQAAIKRVSKLSWARDNAAMAAANWPRKE